jgi:hypothetical protein
LKIWIDWLEMKSISLVAFLISFSPTTRASKAVSCRTTKLTEEGVGQAIEVMMKWPLTIRPPKQVWSNPTMS